MTRRSWFAAACAVLLCCATGIGQEAPAAGQYRVLRTLKVGGDGGFSYLFADAAARRLYVPRSGPAGRITIFDLDTLAPAGEIPNVDAQGVTIDPKSHHGFASSQPVVMFDSRDLKVLKKIPVDNHPDRLLFDSVSSRVFVFSKQGEETGGEKVVVLDAAQGTVVGSVDVGGTQEEGVSDGKGRVFINVEEKGAIAVVDPTSLTVTGRYDLQKKGGHCGGLAMDHKNGILFAACRVPAAMVILRASDGQILQTFPIETSANGAVFNPATMETLSASGNCGTASNQCGPVGTVRVVKEQNRTTFVMAQTLPTVPRAKTLVLDTKNGHLVLMAAEYDAPPPGGGRATMRSGSFSLLIVGK